MNLQTVEGAKSMALDFVAVGPTAPGDWYAFLIQPGRERRICDWLEHRQNFAEAYWPHYQSKVKLSRNRKGIRARGVIPGYLFVRSNYSYHPLSFRLILDHSCVFDVMRGPEGNYRRISVLEIQKIKVIEEALNKSTIAAERGIPFQVGQIVKIRNDLWWSLRGKVVSIDKPGQIIVEGDMFGRKCKITLPASEIEAV
jgi:transcription antitermination factor NusG